MAEEEEIVWEFITMTEPKKATKEIPLAEPAKKYKCDMCGKVSFTKTKEYETWISTQDTTIRRICAACEENGEYIIPDEVNGKFLYAGDSIRLYDGRVTGFWFMKEYRSGITGNRFYMIKAENPPKALVPTSNMGMIVWKYLSINPNEQNMCLPCKSCGKLFFAGERITLEDRLNEHTCAVCIGGVYPKIYEGIKELEGVGRTIGIEVECEPTRKSQDDLAAWKKSNKHMLNATKDNSLRGMFPCEFTSPILHESNYKEWVDKFCSLLDARVYSRCGLHIHLGSNDLSWFELTNMMAYCTIHEHEFFSIVSKSRGDHKHGQGSGLPMHLPFHGFEKLQSRKELIGSLYGIEAAKHGVYTDGYSNEAKFECPIKKNKRANDQDGPRYDGLIHRYLWLNIHAHFFKRAIEIRLHQGTTNPTKIKNWIDLWLCLIPKITQRKNLFVGLFDLMPEDLKCYYKTRSIELQGMMR